MQKISTQSDNRPQKNRPEAEGYVGMQTHMRVVDSYLTTEQPKQYPRRVEIPKDNGKKRLLGIPTVVDRMIQQAIAQVLTPIYAHQFSQGSYGFRPNRGAKQALVRVTGIVNQGYRYAVDIAACDCIRKAKPNCAANSNR